MGLISAIAIYFVIWWTVLFIVLPLGVRSQLEAGDVVPGSAPSAPAAPRLLWRVGVTTAVTTVVFLLFYVATQVYGIGAQSFPRIIPGT